MLFSVKFFTLTVFLSKKVSLPGHVQVMLGNSGLFLIYTARNILVSITADKRELMVSMPIILLTKIFVCFRVSGIFWKAARVGERLSPYVAISCVLMACSILFWSWSSSSIISCHFIQEILYQYEIRFPMITWNNMAARKQDSVKVITLHVVSWIQRSATILQPVFYNSAIDVSSQLNKINHTKIM